eukprot:COSAG01_NODE_18197_length_1094_cov_0.925628_1_plen_46_part_10
MSFRYLQQVESYQETLDQEGMGTHEQDGALLAQMLESQKRAKRSWD